MKKWLVKYEYEIAWVVFLAVLFLGVWGEYVQTPD